MMTNTKYLVLAIPNDPKQLVDNGELPMVVDVHDKHPSHLALNNAGLYPVAVLEACPN